MAEGTGMHHPPGVHRQAVPPWCGALARASASLPPALLNRCPQEESAAGESQRQTSRGCSHHVLYRTDVLTARMRAIRTSMKTPDLRCTFSERLLTQCVKGAFPGLGLGSAAESSRASPPRQLERTPPGAAACVICDHTIETFFSDQKSRGFHSHTSHISDVQRLSRL
jgi:hypothetical protein